MLIVKDLEVSIDGKDVLRGCSLQVEVGEVHAIMGPNGAGKSTLASVLAGHPAYEIRGGSIDFLGQNLLELSPEERSRLGLFKSFQYPVELTGITAREFLYQAVNLHRKKQEKETLTREAFDLLLAEKMKSLSFRSHLLDRDLHVHYSGGEKKKSEMLQMDLLEPRLAILDEMDSGLDVDALREVAKALSSFRSPKRSMILITHYEKFLQYVSPDWVHVMVQGKIVASGKSELIAKLEREGYQSFL